MTFRFLQSRSKAPQRLQVNLSGSALDFLVGAIVAERLVEDFEATVRLSLSVAETSRAEGFVAVVFDVPEVIVGMPIVRYGNWWVCCRSEATYMWCLLLRVRG